MKNRHRHERKVRKRHIEWKKETNEKTVTKEKKKIKAKVEREKEKYDNRHDVNECVIME
mgnify:CR=1 FL=1